MATPIDWHRSILRREPTATQLRLYTSFPQTSGFSHAEMNQELATAAVITALQAGTGRDQVVILRPPAADDFLLKHISKIADAAFDSCRQWPEVIQGNIEGYVKLFRKLTCAGRLLQMPEPQYWVSFGFTVSDPIPDWVRTRLIGL